ncbi:MAG TPA: RluA family pseudouridine synthase [Pirellulales bacterium]|jgi:23S rRNA pseudouridine1911/1915/1917 synthase|nr:RluA family pseudouridine synthase [Pirellulales bacterium]
MPESSIHVLYESGPCLAVLKPAGLATQAPPGIDSLEARIKALLAARNPQHEAIYLAVPHRLDRPVSGAMIFATRRRAAHKISLQFERREVRKTYWACVEGGVSPAEGTWIDHVRKVYGHPKAEIVPADHPEARRAVLHYRTLGRTTWGSWLEIELETGRTHQIRLQAASRGHPVLGDAFYGGGVPFGVQHVDERLRAIALHGRSLSFRDPSTKEIVTVTAPLPEAWQALALPRAN